MAATATKPAAAPKVSKVPADETKAQKFVRLGKPRMVAALKAVDILGNLAGSGYEYTPEQVAKMRQTVQEKVNETFAKFSTDKKGGKPSFDF